jgi:LPS-assembly lipoprotein
VALDLTEEGLAISGSNDITRYNVVGVAGYTLYSLSSGEFLLQGKVDSFTSYSASQQPVATQAAERDARARLMIALADKISAKLLIAARRF